MINTHFLVLISNCVRICLRLRTVVFPNVHVFHSPIHFISDFVLQLCRRKPMFYSLIHVLGKPHCISYVLGESESLGSSIYEEGPASGSGLSQNVTRCRP